MLSHHLLPAVQMALSAGLQLGNEQAYQGRDGWLYYRADVDHVTGPGFLESSWLRSRMVAEPELSAPPQPDPRVGILHFQRQLAKRNVELVIMPTPLKSMIQPEKFTSRFQGTEVLHNSSYDELIQELREAGVLVFDPTAVLKRVQGERDPFLRTDSHWTQGGMDAVANALALFLNDRLPFDGPTREYRRKVVEVANVGDIALMLGLAEDQSLFPPERVGVAQVFEASGGPWQARSDAEILVLGDSFSNIYSSAEMGWGSNAGFVEQLSFHLQRSCDRIVQNDDAAFRTVQQLSRELARGNDRLEGKRVVVWQFAARELSIGDWKEVDLLYGGYSEASFVAPAPGTERVFTGTVEALSSVPRPRSVPYKDHIMAAHLVEVSDNGISVPGAQALVYLWSMRNQKLTAAASLERGQSVRLKVKPWAEVESQLGSINRSELTDGALLVEEYGWAEPISP